MCLFNMVYATVTCFDSHSCGKMIVLVDIVVTVGPHLEKWGFTLPFFCGFINLLVIQFGFTTKSVDPHSK